MCKSICYSCILSDIIVNVLSICKISNPNVIDSIVSCSSSYLSNIQIIQLALHRWSCNLTPFFSGCIKRVSLSVWSLSPRQYFINFSYISSDSSPTEISSFPFAFPVLFHLCIFQVHQFQKEVTFAVHFLNTSKPTFYSWWSGENTACHVGMASPTHFLTYNHHSRCSTQSQERGREVADEEGNLSEGK